MNILAIGDLHFKENLGYSDFVKDRRVSEKKEVLDFIVKSAEDCETVVLLGDNLNSRNNTSEVLRDFIAFIERFDKKEVYIIAGNHEKKGSGKSAIDFMKEIGKPNWQIITNSVEHCSIQANFKLTFCPYFAKSELEVDTDDEGTKKLMEKLTGGDILFHHHAVTDTSTTSGMQTNIFEEILLPKKELEKKYKLIVAGHIHKPQRVGNTIVAGSIFNDTVGETGKSVWKINTSTMETEEIKLPGRSIYKLENPTEKQLDDLDKNDIVKVVLTKKREVKEITSLKEKLEKFEAYVLLEQYPHERKKVHFEEGTLDFDIEKLLETYAKQKKVPLDKLKLAFALIK